MKLLDIYVCIEINGKVIFWKQNWKRLLGKNVKEKEKEKLKFLIFNFYSKFLLYIDN